MYASIDELPVMNWWKIHETSQLIWLIKKKRLFVEDLQKHFDKLNDEYIDRFGISEGYRELLELKRERELLYCDLVLTEDRVLENFIAAKDIEIQALINDTDKVNMDEVKASIEKFMGFRLDERNITVAQFYTYLNYAKNAVKSGKKDG